MQTFHFEMLVRYDFVQHFEIYNRTIPLIFFFYQKIYDLLSRWIPFPITPWFVLYYLWLHFWHLCWAWGFDLVWKWHKRNFVSRYNQQNILIISDSLLKWESLPASGVTRRFFVIKPVTNGWKCFSLFNEITAVTLLEKVFIWLTAFTCWLLGRTATPSAVAVVVALCTFLWNNLAVNFLVFFL